MKRKEILRFSSCLIAVQAAKREDKKKIENFIVATSFREENVLVFAKIFNWKKGNWKSYLAKKFYSSLNSNIWFCKIHFAAHGGIAENFFTNLQTELFPKH
jgi:hypothetical protein